MVMIEKEGATRRILALFCLTILLICCGKQERVDRVVENGVEVVRNKLRPYQIEDSPRNLQVDKKVLINFQGEEITKLGIADIRGFDLDSEGNIYISVFRGEYCLHEFDPEGRFIMSFARKGQGPGEMPIAKSLNVNDRNEILVHDIAKQKLVIFDDGGRLLKEIELPPRVTKLFPLSNGNYLVSTTRPERPSPFYYLVDLSVYDSDLKEITRLEQLKIPNGFGASYWLPWKDRIYVSSEERRYDIWVYDLKGDLIRKIKKEYDPVKIPEDIRAELKSAYEGLKLQTRSSDDFHVPEHWPPFLAFFVDEEGYLFVRTFEEGRAKGEYVHDVFDPSGAFVGRIGLDLDFSREREYAKARRGGLYGFTRDDSGYEQLVVYRMSWNK
jgi:hypothetical protein